MGSLAAKNSPLHTNKTRIPTHQSMLMRTNLGQPWTNSTPSPTSLPFSDYGHPLHLSLATGASSSAVKNGSPGLIGKDSSDPWGQSTESRNYGDLESNSVWGMALNTTWGDGSNEEQDRNSLLANSSNHQNGGRHEVSRDNTSLVWSNNPLPSSIRGNDSTHSKQLFNGNTNGRYDASSNKYYGALSSTPASSVSTNVSGLQALGLVSTPPSRGSELSYPSSMWPSLPVSSGDRQSLASPVWSQPPSKSRFTFANPDNRETMGSDGNSPLDRTNSPSVLNLPLPPAMWQTQSAFQGASSTSRFPQLDTEDTFSALKSLISAAPKPVLYIH